MGRENGKNRIFVEVKLFVLNLTNHSKKKKRLQITTSIIWLLEGSNREQGHGFLFITQILQYEAPKLQGSDLVWPLQNHLFTLWNTPSFVPGFAEALFDSGYVSLVVLKLQVCNFFSNCSRRSVCKIGLSSVGNIVWVSMFFYDITIKLKRYG